MDEKKDEGDWKRGSWALYKREATLIVVAGAQCPYDVGTVMGCHGVRVVCKNVAVRERFIAVSSRDLRGKGEGEREGRN